MKAKMEIPEAKKVYQRRKETVELPYGHIKYNLGFTDYLTNGLKGAKNEFNLACISYNLRRIRNIIKEKGIKIKDWAHKYRNIEGRVSKSQVRGRFSIDFDSIFMLSYSNFLPYFSLA